MAELLLELFSEEIPARMQGRARDDLARLLGNALGEAGLEFQTIKTFATPRRLTAVVEGLPKRCPDRRDERQGPKVDAEPDAIQGFLKSVDLTSVGQLAVREGKKGSFYLALIERPGRATSEVIAEIVPKIVHKFPWPKSMRWGSGKLRWVRPLHSILCLLDGKVVEFEIDGIRSGKETRGHRFMAPEPFSVKSFADYEKKLREAKVILDGNDRARIISDKAHSLAKRHGLALVKDEALLAENAGLTEWPIVLMGKFDESFLTVPNGILVTSMRTHQKCFALSETGLLGTLTNCFVIVANLEAKDDGRAIIAGNERVIRARLADAKFFFDQDRKRKLDEECIPKLKEITFHEQLGTQYERMTRIRELAPTLIPLSGLQREDVDRAAMLSKSDLVTNVVGEFPELQGLMGRFYALDQKERTTVADALAGYYKPQGPKDEVPREPVTVAVALADKIDLLVCFWTIGQKPTGSKDPFALRRAALGVIRIILENELRVHLIDVFERHATRVEEALASSVGGRIGTGTVHWNGRPVRTTNFDLLAFFADRLKVHLKEQGARHDLVDAVFALGGDDLLMVVRRVEALGRFLDTEDGEHLLTGTKRAINILRIEEKKDARVYDEAPDPKLLKLPEEKALAKAVDDVEKAAATAVAREDFGGAMAEMAKLRKPVDEFFDHVTVNATETDLRANRLRLLNRIRATTLAVADFSKIEG